MFCEDCGSDNFVEVEGNLTCRSCGLVAMERYTMVADWKTQYYIDNCVEHFQCTTKKEHAGNDILSMLEIPLNLTVDIMNLVQEMLKELSYKGDARRNAFVTAAIYYANPTSTIPQLSQATGLSIKAINQAASEIFEKTIKFRRLVESRNQRNEAINDHEFNRYINQMEWLTYRQVMNVKREVNKMHDKFDTMPEMKPFKEDKILITMIYESQIKLHIPVDINVLCKICSISKVTLKKIGLVMSALARVSVAPAMKL